MSINTKLLDSVIIPSNSIHINFSISIMLLSFFIAIITALTALNIIDRLSSENEKNIRLYWMLGGSLAIGIGIWSTDFISILACSLPDTTGFNISWSIFSLIVVIVFSLMSLLFLKNKNTIKKQRLLFSATIFGIGIFLSHYVFMEGIKINLHISYQTVLFIISFIISIALSQATFFLFLKKTTYSLHVEILLKTISIFLLGFAIIGTHYASLFSTVMISHALTPTTAVSKIEQQKMALYIAMFSGTLVGIAYIIASYRKLILYAQQEVEKYEAGFGWLSQETLDLQNDLIFALEKNQFIVYFQPIFTALDEKIVGCEALLYWQHPKKGLLSPGEFIPLCEATGFIIPLGEWVLQTVCSQIKSWKEMGHTQLFVAVNLSQRQFNSSELVNVIENALKNTQIETKNLKLEITESLLIKNIEQCIVLLKRLQKIGLSFSLDDFGTGYSSLSYLRKLPIDTIKIDKSFINDITILSDSLAITEAIIAMGKSLGLKIVAEGVETRQQFEILQKQGCDFIQGYLFGKPLIISDFTKLL